MNHKKQKSLCTLFVCLLFLSFFLGNLFYRESVQVTYTDPSQILSNENLVNDLDAVVLQGNTTYENERLNHVLKLIRELKFISE